MAESNDLALLLHPTFLAGVAVFITMLAKSWYSWRYLSRLRVDFEDLWKETGRRTLRTDLPLNKSYQTVRYLQNRDFINRPDLAERAFCESHRLGVVVSYWLLCGSSVLFFALLLTLGYPSSSQ